jgi:hypothetical protein
MGVCGWFCLLPGPGQASFKLFQRHLFVILLMVAAPRVRARLPASPLTPSGASIRARKTAGEGKPEPPVQE